mmetsp:Transcript_8293/g.17588  ORF Transcript_8293/g.17588 Transcript_8293/m.17588 type:complete len:604 (+) Transcript_8293:50-1861(+)
MQNKPPPPARDRPDRPTRLYSVGRLGAAVVLGVALEALAGAVNARAAARALRDELVVAGGGRGELEEANNTNVGEARARTELARDVRGGGGGARERNVLVEHDAEAVLVARQGEGSGRRVRLVDLRDGVKVTRVSGASGERERVSAGRNILRLDEVLGVDHEEHVSLVEARLDHVRGGLARDVVRGVHDVRVLGEVGGDRRLRGDLLAPDDLAMARGVVDHALNHAISGVDVVRGGGRGRSDRRVDEHELVEGRLVPGEVVEAAGVVVLGDGRDELDGVRVRRRSLDVVDCAGANLVRAVVPVVDLNVVAVRVVAVGVAEALLQERFLRRGSDAEVVARVHLVRVEAEGATCAVRVCGVGGGRGAARDRDLDPGALGSEVVNELARDALLVGDNGRSGLRSSGGVDRGDGLASAIQVGVEGERLEVARVAGEGERVGVARRNAGGLRLRLRAVDRAGRDDRVREGLERRDDVAAGGRRSRSALGRDGDRRGHVVLAENVVELDGVGARDSVVREAAAEGGGAARDLVELLGHARGGVVVHVGRVDAVLAVLAGAVSARVARVALAAHGHAGVPESVGHVAREGLDVLAGAVARAVLWARGALA